MRANIRLLVFIVLAVLGTAYVGARYVGIARSTYTVTIEMPETGGVFVGSEVTYRGVPVGRVRDIRLTDGGIAVLARVDSSAPDVPDDVDAVVANRSAIGEQYLDLRPRRDGGPFLAEGSVVRPARAALPLPLEDVLLSADRFVSSIPTDALRTVVDEAHAATEGAGPNIRALLDSTDDVTRQATEHLPQTRKLIVDAGTALATQVESGTAIHSFSSDLKSVAAQLKASDGDLRSLLSTAPAAATQISGLLRETGPNLGGLLSNLLTTSTVLVGKRDGVERILIVAPAAVSAVTHAARDGRVHVGLVTTFFDPLPCAYDTPYRNGLDTSPAPLNTGARCATAKEGP